MPSSRVFVLSLLLAAAAVAQPPRGEPSIAVDHIQLNSADPDKAIAFWRDIIGASTLSADGMKGVGTSGVTILFTAKAPSGPSVGSAIDHLAVRVADLQPYLDNLAKTTYKITHPPSDKTRILIEGPDGLRVEMLEDSSMYTALEFSHIHLYSAKPKDTQAWYAKNFSARPGPADGDVIQLPGATLMFTQGDAPAPSSGRAVDHITFEVRDLEGTVRKLSETGATIDTPPHADPSVRGSSAILIDPWGTRLELINRAAH